MSIRGYLRLVKSRYEYSFKNISCIFFSLKLQTTSYEKKIFINNNAMIITNCHVFNESNFYNPLHLTTHEHPLMFEYWAFHEFGTGYSGTHSYPVTN
jgi:hypothetical protein